MLPIAAVAPLAILCSACPAPSCSESARRIQEYRAAQGAAAATPWDAEMEVLEAAAARIDSARAALAKAAAPPRGQLVQLLAAEQSCRGCALAFVVSKRVSGPDVTRALLGSYRADDPYALRSDTFTYLSSVLDARQRVESVQLIRRILCAETDPSLLARAAFHIDEFGRVDAAQMYACYLQRGPTIRRIAFGLLEGAGGEMVRLVKEQLATQGAHDALRYLSEAEAGAP